MYKPITLLIIATLVLFMSSCDDKEEPTLSLSPSDLVQTTWYGTDTSFDNDQETGTINFILEFLSSSNGTYIFVDEKGQPYGNGSFKYQIKGKLYLFLVPLLETGQSLNALISASSCKHFYPKNILCLY